VLLLCHRVRVQGGCLIQRVIFSLTCCAVSAFFAVYLLVQGHHNGSICCLDVGCCSVHCTACCTAPNICTESRRLAGSESPGPVLLLIVLPFELPNVLQARRLASRLCRAGGKTLGQLLLVLFSVF
jgi:hypothetical protein